MFGIVLRKILVFFKILSPMATLNPFQTYSQRENTITNNVLLLFSGLYEVSPTIYEKCLNILIEGTEYSVTPNFIQQRSKGLNGVVDGIISVQPSTVVIETKVHSLETKSKLLKYASAFRHNSGNVLLHLSSERYPEEEVTGIQQSLNKAHRALAITFVSITYEDLIGAVASLVEDYPFEAELARLSAYFKDYCTKMGLLPSSKYILRVVPSRPSLAINEEFELYFQPVDRGYSNFEYLGLYSGKAVRFIGRVELEIETKGLKDGSLDLEIKGQTNSLTEKQLSRILGAIRLSKERLGWELENNFRFFLLKEFTETNYAKSSKFGIQGARFFDLSEILPGIEEEEQSAVIVAGKLANKSWS